jgi:multidrug resistance efflux pump
MDVSKTSTRSRVLSVDKKMILSVLLIAGAIIAAVVWLSLRREAVRLKQAQQAIVMQGDLQPFVEVLGTIRPLGLQTVPAQTAGRIVSIDVEPGQSVKAGTILLVMANDAAQSDLATARMKYAEASSRVEIAKAQAESDVASSRAQLLKARTAEAYARSQYQATVTVSKLGVVSRMQLEEMKVKLDMSEADTAAAETALSSASKVAAAKMRGQIEESNVLKQELDRHLQQVAELVVRAPKDGFIADRTAEAGTNVTTGTPLLTFVDNSGYYVQLNIPEEASQKVHVGDKVRIAIGSKELDGRVSRIAPLSKKGYVTADAVFANKEASLPSIDSTVQVQIRRAKLQNVLYVRAPADINGSQTAAIDVIQQGSNRVTRRQVDFGARVGEFVVVRNGLAKGDRILIH